MDPSWDATVTPLPETVFRGRRDDDSSKRWDGQSVHAWEGGYGDYLTAKVAKAFPELAAALR